MKKIVIASIAAIAFSQGALAADFFGSHDSDGAYIGANGGATFLGKQKWDYANGSSVTKLENEYKTGYSIGAVIGYRYGNTRFSASYDYLRNNPEKVTVTSTQHTNPEGNLSVSMIMANGYYDFHNDSQFTPYVGLGIGAARFSYDIQANSLKQQDQSKTRFGFQGTAGVAYELNQQVRLDANYRYFGSRNVAIEANQNGTSGAEPTSKPHYSNSVVALGLTYSIM